MLKRWMALALALCLLTGSCLAWGSTMDETTWKRLLGILPSDVDNPIPEEYRLTVRPGNWGAAWKEENWLSILILSTDSMDIRQNFGRADVAMVCAVNLKTGAVRLLSLPVDAPVPVEGLPEKIDLEYVNCFGGPGLMVKTVNEALHLPLTRYCAVNLNSFVATLDQLGGVNMRLADAEARVLGLQPGDNHLTGAQALEYVKIRQEGDRQMRARQLLEALAHQVTSGFTLKDGFTLLNFFITAIDTNLTYDNLLDILMAVLDGPKTVAFSARGISYLTGDAAEISRDYLYGAEE